MLVQKIKKKIQKIVMDEKGGPGLEEAVLLVFIGLVVSTAADSLGNIIDKSFQAAIKTLRDALGVS